MSEPIYSPEVEAMLEPLLAAKAKGKRKFKVETDQLIALVRRLGDLENAVEEHGIDVEWSDIDV